MQHRLTTYSILNNQNKKASDTEPGHESNEKGMPVSTMRLHPSSGKNKSGLFRLHHKR
jgi:hypothetical protein